MATSNTITSARGPSAWTASWDRGTPRTSTSRLFGNCLRRQQRHRREQIAHGRLQACDLPIRRRPARRPRVDDKLFDAAKLTGKAAYATMLGILNDWRPAQGALKKAAAKAGKSKVKSQPLGQHQAAGARAVAVGDLLRRRELRRPRRRDGAPHEPAARARSAHARPQGLALHQGAAHADRSRARP